MDEVRVIEIKKSVFEDNDKDADALRKELKTKGVFLLNLMSAPGSGKTTTLIQTLNRIKDKVRVAVMEADIDSDVDAVKIVEATGELPVNFKAREGGTYTISVSIEGLEVDYLHLIDNMTGVDTDLLQTPSYSFESKTTDYESRFKLAFAADEAVCGPSEAFAFISNGEIIVDGEGMLQVIDMTGRIIINRDAAGHVSTNGMTPGVYVLRLINGERIKTQKIILN